MPQRQAKHVARRGNGVLEHLGAGFLAQHGIHGVRAAIAHGLDNAGRWRRRIVLAGQVVGRKVAQYRDARKRGRSEFLCGPAQPIGVALGVLAWVQHAVHGLHAQGVDQGAHDHPPQVAPEFTRLTGAECLRQRLCQARRVHKTVDVVVPKRVEHGEQFEEFRPALHCRQILGTGATVRVAYRLVGKVDRIGLAHAQPAVRLGRHGLVVRPHPGGQRAGHVQHGDALIRPRLHQVSAACHRALGGVHQPNLNLAQVLAHVAVHLIHAVAHFTRALKHEVLIGRPLQRVGEVLETRAHPLRPQLGHRLHGRRTTVHQHGGHPVAQADDGGPGARAMRHLVEPLERSHIHLAVVGNGLQPGPELVVMLRAQGVLNGAAHVLVTQKLVGVHDGLTVGHVVDLVFDHPGDGV